MHAKSVTLPSTSSWAGNAATLLLPLKRGKDAPDKPYCKPLCVVTMYPILRHSIFTKPRPQNTPRPDSNQQASPDELGDHWILT
jgi:hypothetical protein